MTSESSALLSSRLLPRERLQWSGRPRRGLLLAPSDMILIPFSLLWGGFVVFWEAMAVTMKAPAFMALFGVPFVIVGLYIVVGRFAVDAWLRGRTHYAITDRRVLILREAPWPSLTAVQLDRLPEATVTEGADGSGTIRFGPSLSFLNTNRAGLLGVWTPSLDPTPQLRAIDDVRTVFALVQKESVAAAGPPRDGA